MKRKRKPKKECCEIDTNIKRNGTQPNGTQRYICKVCGRSFSEERSNKKYKRSTDRILSLLLNILENDFFNENDLEEALDKMHPVKTVKKVVFNTEYLNKKDMRNFTINCFNPKLLICQDDRNITFIQIPSYNKNQIDISASEQKDYEERIININDNIAYKNLIKQSNKIVPLIKE